MKDSKIKLLEQLIKIPSPSGFEEQIAEFIKTELLKILPQKAVVVDFQNNVTAVVKGKLPYTIMIDAHSDEIGFIVNNVTDQGILNIIYIGGGDHSILSARELVILTQKNKINAVVDRKHAHLVEDEDDETIVNTYNADVDIGIRKRKEVLKLVRIGDPVVYKPAFNHLIKDYYAGYGFDDKTGCYILLETIKEIAKANKQYLPNLVFTFSSQEEIYGRKCRPLIKRYKPDLFIEVDVTFATDYLYEDVGFQREAGKCELGKGIVLYRGTDIDKKTLHQMEAIAYKYKIKVQYQASTGDIGYTATEVTNEGNGIKALILGIPLRNMHTPVEIINLKDLTSGVQLLKQFLLNYKHVNIK